MGVALILGACVDVTHKYRWLLITSGTHCENDRKTSIRFVTYLKFKYTKFT